MMNAINWWNQKYLATRGIQGNIMVLSDFLGSRVVLCQLRGWKTSVKKLRVRVTECPPSIQTVLVLFLFFCFSLIYLHLSCQQVGLRLIYPRDEPSDRLRNALGEYPCPTSMLEAFIAEGRLGVVWTEQYSCVNYVKWGYDRFFLRSWGKPFVTANHNVTSFCQKIDPNLDSILPDFRFHIFRN